MWSFVVTVLFFAIVIGLGALLQRKTTRQIKQDRPEVKAAINQAAEIAQRRHKAAFGREDTGLHQTMAPKVRHRRA
jgi:preprotein translocase subunit SecG